jgi:cobyric acid synthase
LCVNGTFEAYVRHFEEIEQKSKRAYLCARERDDIDGYEIQPMMSGAGSPSTSNTTAHDIVSMSVRLRLLQQ